MKTRNVRFLALALVTVLLCSMLASCSSKANADADFYDEYMYTNGNNKAEMEYEKPEETATLGGSAAEDGSIVGSVADSASQGESALISNPEKLVYKANISIETKTFDEAVAALRAQVAELGGIVQSESYSDDMPSDYYYGDAYYYRVSGYKRFETTVRIPTASFQTFLDRASTIGHLRSSSSYVDNITQSYYSTKAYLDSYKAQLEVLQGMYDKAFTIEEMITIESRIAEVQAQINRLTTDIQSMDRDVAYSTVHLIIDEVEVYSDTPREEVQMTFGENVKSHFASSWRGFVEGLQEFVLMLIDSMWGLIVFALLVLAVVFIVRRNLAKNRKKADARAKAYAMNQSYAPQAQPPVQNAPIAPNGDNTAQKQ